MKLTALIFTCLVTILLGTPAHSLHGVERILPLPELVRRAPHIFVGRVVEAKYVDDNGRRMSVSRVLKRYESMLEHPVMDLTVRVSETLKGTGAPLPRTRHFRFYVIGMMWTRKDLNSSLRYWRQNVGKDLIFLTERLVDSRGRASYWSTDVTIDMYPVAQKQAIRGLIAGKSLQSQPATESGKVGVARPPLQTAPAK